MVFVSVGLPALLGISVLALEGNRVRIASSELQHAVDSAALAAAVDLPDALAASSAGHDYAMLNVPENRGEIVKPSDVISGNWDFVKRTHGSRWGPVRRGRVLRRGRADLQ